MTALSPIFHSSNATGNISLRYIRANLRWQFYFFCSFRHFWLCILLRLRSSIMKDIIQAIIEKGLVVKLGRSMNLLINLHFCCLNYEDNRLPQAIWKLSIFLFMISEVNKCKITLWTLLIAK